MKLTDITTNNQVTLYVLDPETGEYLEENGKRVYITFKGISSDAFTQESNRQRLEAVKMEKRGEWKSGAKTRQDAAKLYAEVCTGWSDNIDTTFNTNAAYEMFEPEHMYWLRDQIDKALLEKARSEKK